MNINQVAYLQDEISQAYMRQYGLKPVDFMAIERKYSILRFIEIGYDMFHLTGTQGVIDEVDAYLKAKREFEAS